MCNGLIKMRIASLISAIVIVLSMTGSVLAVDHWWHGGISNDVNDPANWTDRNVSTPPTTPTGDPRDIVRIGGSWDSEDLNSNGVLDEGEDLNGNGVIDDPNPGFGVGYGGYYGDGGGIALLVNPVLSSTYVSRTGGAEGGWWFVLNAPNILTLREGAFLIMDEENCNLRNGGRLEVQGRSSTNGPSLITARRFRIAENGSIEEAAGETCQLRINGTGWVQMDPTLDGNGEAFMIGTSNPPGTMPRGEIIIEEQGRLELLSANPDPYLVFGNANPLVNQIIIRDKGELWLPGDTATMGRVGPDNTVTSLQEMIDMGLITSDHGILTISGANPTVVKVAKLRITNPSPTDGQKNVAKQAVLSWNSGTLAATHDVYSGTDPDSVNDANRTNPLGVLKSQDQVETYYPQAGTLDLEFGQTYYWRIDEVNNLSDQPIYKGDLWSFTVEPLAFQLLAETISVTASSQVQGQGPENTINGSGLVEGNHSTILTDMWLSESGDPGSAWIQYEFDKVYGLDEMLVWNYNGQSLLRATGLNDIVVEYSTDGTEWIQIDSVSKFEQATGTDDYAYNTIVTFDGAPVKYVKIMANSNWSGGFINQYGLSEVQFMYIPVGARLPEPDDGAVDVAIDTSLSWRSGRGAAEHSIYLNTDSQLVADGTIPAETIHDAIYGPLSLDLGKTYYWRVDEVNNANTIPVWEGNVWSFTTSEYLVVDDFDSYNDIPEGEGGSNLVYLSWSDGGYGEFNDPTNGSIIGYLEGKSLENLIVHEGIQSVPVMYNNTTAGLSEITADTRDLQIGTDWTVGAPATLSLWFYGDTDNPVTDRMYVKVNGVMSRYDGDLAQAQWHEFTIDLASLGIDLGNVTSLIIGFESSDSGSIFLDDIRLYAP